MNQGGRLMSRITVSLFLGLDTGRWFMLLGSIAVVTLLAWLV
jgi:hypothetical protein